MTSPALASGTRSNDRPKRLIAIVDGDGVHLYYTSMLLQRLDYDIHAMRTAGEVLDLLDMARPALILTELGLPDMDGLEFIRKIKRNPHTYGIPIIVYTSRQDPAARDACMKEVCKDFLQKPTEPEVLYAAIQKVTETTPRQFIRLATSLNVMLGSGKDADLSATQDTITALSEQGMFVSTPKPIAAGARIPVEIFLEHARIRVEGEVLYSFEQGQGPLRTSGMGIKFIRIEPADQERVRSFIRREITKDLYLERPKKTTW
ncbi:MAG: response regulator [Nitrospirae bacterium]|jgi:CheY-like chemotaxis protein|nr:response regulator [Nitrospirota bacterium]NTW67168.1 response regulator [Nitrospirota bacterium]